MIDNYLISSVTHTFFDAFILKQIKCHFWKHHPYCIPKDDACSELSENNRYFSVDLKKKSQKYQCHVPQTG